MKKEKEPLPPSLPFISLRVCGGSTPNFEKYWGYVEMSSTPKIRVISNPGFPGRATDMAVPTGWMILGTLEKQFQTSLHVYRKVKLAFLFILSGIAHSHI